MACVDIQVQIKAQVVSIVTLFIAFPCSEKLLDKS